MRTTWLALALLAAPAVGQEIRVGHKSFPEQRVLGQIVSVLLERAAGKRVRTLELGGTPVCHRALVAGEIDVYVEYTGSGLRLLGLEASHDPDPDYETVAAAYRERFGCEWLPRLGYNATHVLAVRRPDASAKGWKTIGDLARDASTLRAGFAPGIATRVLPRLGFEFGAVQAVEPALMFRAIADGSVDVICTHVPNWAIEEHGLRVLEDDRSAFVPYEPAPVVRAGLQPKIASVLRLLAGTIDAGDMATMIREVDKDGTSPRVVARRFLEARGLIEAEVAVPMDEDRIWFVTPIDMLLEQALLAVAPELIVLLFALVAVCVAKRRKPAAFVLVGAAILVLAGIAYRFYVDWLYGQQAMNFWGPDHVAVVGGKAGFFALRLTGLAFLVVAALKWRTTREDAPSLGEAVPLPGVRPISKGAFLSFIYGPFILGLVCILGSLLLVRDEDTLNLGFAVLLGGVLLEIVGAIVLCVLIHRLWSAIQADPKPRTTPSKAVGFLFIPLFNYYWVFQAYWGWAKDYNRLVAARNLSAPRVSEGLALTLCILIVCSAVPYVGIPIALVAQVLLALFLGAAIDGVNALAGPARLPARGT